MNGNHPQLAHRRNWNDYRAALEYGFILLLISIVVVAMGTYLISTVSKMIGQLPFHT